MAAFTSRGASLQVLVNGVRTDRLLHASIVNSNCFSSDHYAVTLAVNMATSDEISFWSSLSTGFVEIDLVDNSSTSQPLISGLIDSMAIDPIRSTVAIEGRDLSSILIDSYRQQDFVNQTASEVVSAVAQQHGLTPVVTPTLGSVGRYYGDGFTRLSLGLYSRLRSDWDLVVQLARENSFDVFVQANNLVFQPSESGNDVPVYIPREGVTAMRFEKSLAIPPNATASVQSWNSRDKTSYSSDSSSSLPDPTQLDGTNVQSASPQSLQPFLFSAANFTSEQVVNCASRFAAELNRLGVTAILEMPWDLSLSPRTTIFLGDTGSALDGAYKIDSIERHFSTTSGSNQVIRAVAA